MNNRLFDNFAETLSVFITKETLSVIRLFKHMLHEPEGAWPSLPEDFNCEIIQKRFFQSVISNFEEKIKSEDVRMNPEETIVGLIHNGIPKENISATFKHLTATLPNANYRLYRADSAFPVGTIRVNRNGYSVNISSGLTTEDTVRFILQLDALLPTIDEAAKALIDQLQLEYRKKRQEIIAQEIARKAVDAQLESVLPGLGISSRYEIADGKVRLHLYRTYTAEVELPIEELPSFLSDPGLVESTLKMAPISTDSEKRPVFPHPFPPKHFHSNIVKHR